MWSDKIKMFKPKNQHKMRSKQSENQTKQNSWHLFQEESEIYVIHLDMFAKIVNCFRPSRYTENITNADVKNGISKLTGEFKDWSLKTEETIILFRLDLFSDPVLSPPQLPGGVGRFLPEAPDQLQPPDQSQQPFQHPPGDGRDQPDPDAGLRERPAALPPDGASQGGGPRQPEHSHRGERDETVMQSGRGLMEGFSLNRFCHLSVKQLHLDGLNALRLNLQVSWHFWKYVFVIKRVTLRWDL